MLDSTHTLVSPTPTTLEGYLIEFESSMSVSFVSEYSHKFQLGHWSIGSGEEDFLRFLPYMGMAAMLVM